MGDFFSQVFQLIRCILHVLCDQNVEKQKPLIDHQETGFLQAVSTSFHTFCEILQGVNQFGGLWARSHSQKSEEFR